MSIYMRSLWGIFNSSITTNKYSMKVQEIINEEWSIDPRKWGTPAAAPKAKVALTGDAKTIANLESWAKANGLTAEKEVIKKTWLSKWSAGWKGFFYLTGYVVISVDALWHLHILEKQYMGGVINATEYKNLRQWYIGYWTIQALTPFIIRFIQTSRWITALGTIIVGLATGGMGLAVLGGLVASFVSQAAFFAALIAVTETPAFRKWAEKFYTEITFVGAISDAIWNEFQQLFTNKDYYQRKKEEKIKVNPEAAARDAEEEKNRQDRSQPLTGPNSIVINGERVTDEKGNLDQLVLAGPFVKNYMDLHPNDPEVKKVLAKMSQK
jgi:hypothetical protein